MSMTRNKTRMNMSARELETLQKLIPARGFNNDKIVALMAQPFFERTDDEEGNEIISGFWSVTELNRAEYEAVAAALNPEHTDLSRMLGDAGFTEGTFEQRLRQALTELKHLREQSATVMQLELR